MAVPRCPKASETLSTANASVFSTFISKEVEEAGVQIAQYFLPLLAHHEPDSGTVQSNKELLVKKRSVTPGWDMTFVEIDETVLKSQSVLVTDKKL